jgi:hypothetical protein
MCPVRLLWNVQSPARSGMPADVSQQVKAGAVGPLHIFDHDHQHIAVCNRSQRVGDWLEQFSLDTGVRWSVSFS